MVSVTVDSDFAVHDIKIIEGPDRLFVAMPSRKDENGVYRDICHPITTAARRQLEDAIIHAYQEYLATAEFLPLEEEEPPEGGHPRSRTAVANPQRGILHTRWHVLAIFPIDGPPGKGGAPADGDSRCAESKPKDGKFAPRWAPIPSAGDHPNGEKCPFAAKSWFCCLFCSQKAL